MDDKSKELLRSKSVDDINRYYMEGNTTYGRYKSLLREKAKLNVQDLDIKGPGQYWTAVANLSLKEAIGAWDDLKTSVQGAAGTGEGQGKPSGNIGVDLGKQVYYAGLGVFGILRAVFAPISAISELSGEANRRHILQMGGSPGLAYLGGLITNLSMGFLPIGKAYQYGAQGVRGAAKAGMLGGEMQKIAKGSQDTQEAMNFVLAAVNDGLKADGAKVMPELGPVLEQASKTIGSTAEVGETVAKAGAFSEDVAKYTKGVTIEEAKGRLKAIADRLGVNLDELKHITPGSRTDPKNPWYENPKKMYGYLKALEDRQAEIGPLAKAAAAGGTDAQLAFGRYMMELFTANPEGKTEFGKELSKMLVHWDPENVARGDFGAALTTFAKDMAYMADEPKKMTDFILKNQSGFFTMGGLQDWWAASREIYLNSLLPLSWVPAFVGNSIATANIVMERAVGALFSADRATGYNNKEAIYLTKGLVLATGDGIKAFGKSYTSASAQQVGRFSHTQAIQGLPGTIVNIPINTVKGMDELFNVMITRASHYAVALREGEQFGLSKALLGQYVTQAVANPTASMLREAKQLAETATFQNQLGVYANQIRRTLQWGPGIFYFPFLKTAINTGIYSYNRSPGLNLLSRQLYKDIAAGGPVADAAIGRLVLAQMVGNMYFELAKDGYITGGGPIDPKTRKSWEFMHERYSVAGPSGWFPLSNMEPGNTVPGLIADYTQILDKLDEPEAEQLFFAVSLSVIHNFGNNTWLPQAEKLTEVVEGLESGKGLKDRSIEALAQPLVNMYPPTSPLASRIAKFIDPIRRENRTLADQTLARMPYYSKSVSPLYDGLGDPVVPPQALGPSWLGFLRPVVPAFKPYETDRLKKLSNDLNVRYPYFSDQLGGTTANYGSIQEVQPQDKPGIKLSSQELADRIQIYRRLVRHPEYGLEAQIVDNKDSGFAEGNRNLKAKMIEQALSHYWQESGKVLQVKNPSIGQRIIQSNFDAAMSIQNEPERSETAREAQAQLKDFNETTPEMQRNLERYGIIGNELPDNVTYSNPYGGLINIKEMQSGEAAGTYVPAPGSTVQQYGRRQELKLKPQIEVNPQ